MIRGDATSPTDPDSGRVRRALRRILPATVAALAFLSLAGHLGPACQPTEIASHFRVHYAVCGALGALACALLGRRRWALLAAAMALLDAAVVVPWYLPPPDGHTPATAPSLRVLLANVNKDNHRPAPLLRLVAAEHPALVVLLETDYRWLRALRPLQASYPHRQIARRDDAFGISVLSARALRRAKTIVLPGTEVPSVLVSVAIGDRELTLLAVHCSPPLSTKRIARRDRHVHAAARLLASLPPPRMLAGDLNLSMWSPVYDELERTSGLHNARRGFGVLPTWPAGPWLLGAALRVPIDHLLVDESIAVTDLRRGPDIGSDHLPLLLDLRVE